MALVPGVRLGHYEILAPLGAGGMGEVYRARDTRLDRMVALKVLPAHLSADAGLKRRLEREGRAVSQLSDPHICTLYDVGSEGETDFLVMEYLEGETLVQRLERGPLPLEQALRTAGEIADALDKAHRHGVVHRDLKPGNVMLTKSGAKLLDFGLARLSAAPSPEEAKDESALPTQQRPLTEEGRVVGTYSYMAPEQLEGRAVDARTDIFAFGALLYEMVTGRRAFEGRSRASLIAAILSSEPRPLHELQPMTPRLLDRVVRRCLAKDPDDRWQSAGDLASELRWVAEGVVETGRAASPTRVAWKTWGLVLAGVGIALVAGVAGSFFVRTPAAPPPPAPVVRAALPLAADEVLAFAENFPLGMGRPSLALSPDGSMVAFVVVEGASTRIHVRRMADAVSAPLGGTEGGFEPFFSPDGQWLAFFTADKLKKVSLRGGEAVTLCDAATTYGGAWGEDDRIVFGAQEGSRLMRVSATGGRPEVLRSAVMLVWPPVLPGSRAILLTAAAESMLASENPDDLSLLAFFPETGEIKLLLQGGSFGRYVPTGHLIYARGGAVHAVPFDAKRVAVMGAAQIACSRDGTLVYVPGQSMIQSELVWIDREGKATPVGFPPQPFGTFQLSPDGRRLAIVVQERRQATKCTSSRSPRAGATGPSPPKAGRSPSGLLGETSSSTATATGGWSFR